MSDNQVLATFHGDDEFPVQWEEGQKELFWVHDDLHIPNPISPMYADIGGWWLKCDYMFRRFGTPFAADWVAKIVNGYVYTAAIPATPGLSVEASEYGSRYTPRVPLDPQDPAELGAYMGWTLPYYAENFLVWWRDRLRPEMEHNFVRFDEYDYEGARLVELAILLEDAIDMHDRHWSIHWVLNFAQFSSTMALNAAVAAAKGEGDHSSLMGRLQSSTVNRNWDSIEELWKVKEGVKKEQGDVARAFERPTAGDVLRALQGTNAGRAFLTEHIEPYQKAFGFKSMYAHEFSFKTWREDPAPIIEAIRGYLESDYDYPAELQAVADDLKKAKAEALEGVEPGPARDELEQALELSLRMNPLTPDHHFYIDQGTNARVRLVLIAIGRKLVAEDRLDDPEDVMYLKYNELRRLMAGSNSFDAKELVGDRRDAREGAYELRPRDWVGTATEESVGFPYWSLWAFPEKLNRPAPSHEGEIPGLPASAGVVEGTARIVLSAEQFGEVERDEIVVCRMTSPSWVVLFTKISGLVTDAGGMASHPAVVSREFGIPAVVGTSDATRRIKTGDRVRVNGSTGRVEILGDVPAGAATPSERAMTTTVPTIPEETDVPTPDAPLLLPFTDPRCQVVELTGGKGASLAAMTAEELPVPPGFVITSAAFRAAVDEESLREAMRRKDVEAARALVASAQPPRTLIEEAFASLSGPVAVRSSACAEDSEGASYAGQQETFLNTVGLEAVLHNVVECWLSFFTDRAVFYRQEKGSLEDVAMAVVVQQMIDSQKSGVLFTVDPVHGRKDRMVVEAARGLGEAVVSGETTPDNYTLSREGVVKKSKVVDAERVLTDEECAALARMGQKLAQLHGGPQDIEWAFDASGDLFLLQSRPITTI